MTYTEIDKRYTQLAESSCCLSCGGAMNYANAERGEICVDLGSGRGTDAIRLAEKAGKEGFVYGIDISEGMIRKAVATAKQLEIFNIEFIHGPLEKIDIAENSVNLVISNCTINHSSDKQSVWDEVYRILKPGGRFVVSDIYSSEAVPEEFRKDPVAISECWAGAVTREEYLGHLRSSGYISTEVKEESAPYKKGKILVSSWTITGYKAESRKKSENLKK
jgi:arsenite methyltransferase